MKRPSDPGFTLLEVMLATTITAVIFVILFAAMRVGHRSEEKGMEREDLAQRSRILNDRLTWLLRGAHPYFIRAEGKETLHFSGRAESVGFVTASVDIYSEGPEDMAGLKWVEIYAAAEGLKMKERVFFMSEEDAAGLEEAKAKELVLDPTVKSVSFLYLDAGRPEGEGAIEEEEETATEGQWVGSWDVEEKDYLPAAIKASISVAFKDGAVDLPPVIARVRSGHNAVPAVEAD